MNSHEIALLILLMENQLTSDEHTSVWQLKDGMEKSGYTVIVTSVAIRTLSKKKMVETFMAMDEWNNGNQYQACKLTELGESWILNNQDQLVFRKEPSTKKEELDDGLPF